MHAYPILTNQAVFPGPPAEWWGGWSVATASEGQKDHALKFPECHLGSGAVSLPELCRRSMQARDDGPRKYEC